jgi:integrase
MWGYCGADFNRRPFMTSKKHSTQFPGVRYRLHRSRKYNRTLDRYFSIRYRVNGKLKEEGIGWASEGWNATKASLVLAGLKKNQLTGEGPQTLTEKREIENEKRETKIAEKKRKAKDQLTFGKYFEDTYFPNAQANKKEWSWKREKSLFKLWISPVIRDMALKDIRPINLERIKKNMMDAEKAPASINYALAVIRQVFNSAKQNRLFSGDSPVKSVKKLKIDNKRFRYLSQPEADMLMNSLKKKQKIIYEMAMISLHCGLRAGEIFTLTWGDINLKEGTILIRDPKNNRNRIAFMTDKIKDIIISKKNGKNYELLFPKKGVQKYREIPKLFRETIDELGFNNGITDRRQKVVFHTLRHTYASWMVQNGEDLYTVKELLGHSTLAMTERYSHLAKDNLKNAVKRFEDRFQAETKEKIIDLKKDKR